VPEILTGTIVAREFKQGEPSLPDKPISIYGQRFISVNGKLRWILANTVALRLERNLWVGNTFEFEISDKDPEIAKLIRIAAPTVMRSLSHA
jgi:hypothetical protein